MSDNLNDFNSSDSQYNENHYTEPSDQNENRNIPPVSDSTSYAYTANDSIKTKRTKKHPLLKAVAFVLCLAIVGVGSVQGYKIYKDNKDKSELDEFNADKDSDSDYSDIPISNNGTNDDEDYPSIIQLAARTDAKALPDIVDDIMPSVVGVSSNFEFTQSYGFFGWDSGPQERQMLGTGTGFIISDDGYIVTNAHVIYDESEYNAGEAVSVSIMFSDETQHDAKIIAYDTETDIAVLKVDETGLKPAVLGNSDDLRVGELVIAVGNPLGLDLFGSVTHGIVSALNRKIDINEKSMTLIQTDAPINSGNSGGPLLNSCGQVIGINSAKISSNYSSGSASVEGLGFAIPITEAKAIIDDLINYNYVKGRPQMGITTSDITEAYSRYLNLPMGVYVVTVEPGSAAEAAGLRKGDVIIDVEGEPVTTADELNQIKSQYKAGDTITLTVNRNDMDVKITLTLEEANAEKTNISDKDKDKNKDN